MQGYPEHALIRFTTHLLEVHDHDYGSTLAAHKFPCKEKPDVLVSHLVKNTTTDWTDEIADINSPIKQ